jgi:hypothetical protein
MASKYGGVAVDETPTAGSKYGGVAVDDVAPVEKPAPAAKPAAAPKAPLPSMFTTAPQPEAEAAGSMATIRGLSSGLFGIPGSLTGMLNPARTEAESVQDATPENIRKLYTKLGWPEPTTEPLKAAQAGGEYAPLVAASGNLLRKGLGLAGEKLGGFVQSFKSPKPIANVEGLTSVGEKGFKLLTDKTKKLFDARSAEAEQKYGEAFDAARKAQAQGEPFATSPQGRSLIQSLENEKNIVAGGQKFGVGEEKVKGIDRLINALKGETTGGLERTAKETPTGKKIYSFTGTPKKTTEKDISAVVEELRFLRDVNAKGKSYEAYAQLDANYKRDLIKKLESALYDWNPEYGAADKAYKASSAKLEPFRTQLMSGALKGEKFNPKDLVASPEEFGTKFFKDVDGVRQLKTVTEDPTQVANLGKEYVATLLAEKSPAQIKRFASNPQNQAWMKEAGIGDAVQKFALEAQTAASRQKILKYLSYGAATAVGVPTGYALRRALGL